MAKKEDEWEGDPSATITLADVMGEVLNGAGLAGLPSPELRLPGDKGHIYKLVAATQRGSKLALLKRKPKDGGGSWSQVMQITQNAAGANISPMWIMEVILKFAEI